MKKFLLAATAALASLSAPQAASASTIVNAGFEAGPVGLGAPTGWFTLNPLRVATVSSFGGYTAQEGSQFAVIAAGIQGIPTLLTQLFSMTQGETISFMVAFATTESNFNDFGGLGIFDFSNLSGTTLFSQSVSSVGAGAAGPWTKVSFTAPTSGFYSINATVQNVGNSRNPSYLLLDAPGVPEPGTWMLMLLGIGAVGFSMRRRRNLRVNFA